MFTNELAERLLKMEKITQTSTITIDLKNPSHRYILSNPYEPGYEFLLEITLNSKVAFKISLHNQENNTKEGLMRVDFKGGHRNPEEITDLVPEILRPYAGHYFNNEAHIHFYVEGYKNLGWALPLSAHHFPVKNIINDEDYSEAISAFAKEINFITPFNIQSHLL